MTPKNELGDMNNEAANESLSDDSHSAAAKAFVDRAQSLCGDKFAELYAFDSPGRGEVHDLTYGVILEYGSAVGLTHSKSIFEQSQEQGNPYFRNVLREACSYV
ncbi:nucleotidyltransferase domain-containing protein [Halocatena marina]|uniref:nucleotidyltransferase domain-containing protein n=1 Tax=Halocatena marina TaxID=2934937 RepID=UPI00200D0418|nr:nucleotidyltransferase domain-containing protein [Halocatena marina]